MAAKFIIGLLIALFLVTFANKNPDMVKISYYFDYEYSLKLWIAVLGSFAAGLILASIGAGFSIVKLRSKSWSQTRQIAKLEEEIGELKQKPLPDEPAVYTVPEPETAQLPPAAVKSLPAAGSQN